MAGSRLSMATDVLDTKLGLGDAFGGLILLAIVTNLPEIAIVVSAALTHQVGIAVGNILGGIAIQTVVLVLLDAVAIPGTVALSYLGASLLVLLEAGMVVAVLSITVMGSQLPSSLFLLGIDPAALLIVVVWVAGLLLVYHARKGLPWHKQGQPPDGQIKPRGHSKKARVQQAVKRGMSTKRAAFIFVIGAAVTLAAGALLELSGEGIADADPYERGHLRVHCARSGHPRCRRSRRASPRFEWATISWRSVTSSGATPFSLSCSCWPAYCRARRWCPRLRWTDIYLTGLGALLSVVYMFGILFRPSRTIARLGIDSAVVLLLYLLGMAGLIAIGGP